ncbi:hypothetical protein D1006_29765 [Burkholderia stabilis]|uniref:Uncharacterized protein n=1 Tax=Burkholderia stabilis TaxID=95485 RepID=A0A4Q2AH33_9BURK|nr:hypothetical protein D1006_29765 [Burkholderia stabilis]
MNSRFPVSYPGRQFGAITSRCHARSRARWAPPHGVGAMPARRRPGARAAMKNGTRAGTIARPRAVAAPRCPPARQRRRTTISRSSVMSSIA